MMKMLRVLPLCALLIFAFAGMAQANSVADPSIIVTSGGGSTSIFSTTFSFISATGSTSTDVPGANVFLNLSGVNFFTLIITIAPPTVGPFSCGVGIGAIFASCNVTGGGSSPVVFTFTGGPGAAGDFDITVAGWASGTTFNAQANVPEPATMTMLLLGLGGMAVRRRFRA
jgi:hypothetical protein